MKRWFAFGFLAVLVVAAALRLPDLRLRPMHNDEAVNAIKFRSLWVGNRYTYDPNEFHGPTLPYFTLPAATLNSSPDFNDFSEKTFRSVTAVFGLGLIACLLLLKKDFGAAETLWAAIFIALSPAMVFYSRYYIHEMLLVVFTALTGFAWWRYCRSGRFGWVLLSGLSLGLMWATKETFVFAIASLVLAGICNGLLGRRRGEEWPHWRIKPALAVFGISLVVATLFFSSFVTNPPGITDAIKTYAPWFHRAQGVTPHAHPWNFYFERLFFYRADGGPIWSEGLIGALALIGFVLALRRDAMLPRLIAFYTAWMTAIYTLLPYKTPWCLLGFYHGAILLAGIGAAFLVGKCPKRISKLGMTALIAAATAHLGWQAWRANFAMDKGGVPYCDTAKNPYVYSQTAPDILRLVQTVDALAKVSSTGYNTVVEVMSPDSYWPLPWYLRRFQQVGFWDKLPNQPPAPIMIVSAALGAAFDERPQRTHLMAGYYELRPGVFFELYVSVNLWTQYIKTLPSEKD